MVVKSGRNKVRVERTALGGGAVILAGALICTAYLMSALSGKPADEAKLDAVSASAISALSENDAVAVFLGLDRSDGAVAVWSEIDGEPTAEIKPAKTMWSCLADMIRKLAE